jgi:hypothetical protein
MYHTKVSAFYTCCNVSQFISFKVLQVSCTKRIGNDDFIASIRKSLQAHYKEKAVGMYFFINSLIVSEYSKFNPSPASFKMLAWDAISPFIFWVLKF